MAQWLIPPIPDREANDIKTLANETVGGRVLREDRQKEATPELKMNGAAPKDRTDERFGFLELRKYIFFMWIFSIQLPRQMFKSLKMHSLLRNCKVLKPFFKNSDGGY